MRNMIVALGSFLLGVLFAFASGLGNPHTSTVWHSVVFAQDKNFSAIDLPGARPVVPTVKLSSLEGVTIGPPFTLKLDGVDCVNCTLLKGATVEYSGGPFSIEGLKHDVVTIKPVGAAQNTAALLARFGLIGCPAQPRPAPIDPNKPMLKKASLKAGRTLTFSSPVGIKP